MFCLDFLVVSIGKVSLMPATSSWLESSFSALNRAERGRVICIVQAQICSNSPMFLLGLWVSIGYTMNPFSVMITEASAPNEYLKWVKVTVLSALHILIYFSCILILWHRYYHSHLLSGNLLSLLRLSYLPRVTLLISGKARIWTQSLNPAWNSNDAGKPEWIQSLKTKYKEILKIRNLKGEIKFSFFLNWPELKNSLTAKYTEFFTPDWRKYKTFKESCDKGFEVRRN